MIKPTKLVLEWRDGLQARFRTDVLAPAPFLGTIEVACDSRRTFGEIVNYLANAHLAIAAVQQAIGCLRVAKGPAARLPDLRLLQEIHQKMTGWNFPSAEDPAPFPLDNPPEAGLSSTKELP